MAFVCHSFAALLAAIGLSNNDVISSRSLRCVGRRPRFDRALGLGCSTDKPMIPHRCPRRSYVPRGRTVRETAHSTISSHNLSL